MKYLFKKREYSVFLHLQYFTFWKKVSNLTLGYAERECISVNSLSPEVVSQRCLRPATLLKKRL